MKCQVTSNTTHNVLIGKEISYKSYIEICSGEPKKINLGYWGNWGWAFNVENNSLVHTPKKLSDYIPFDFKLLNCVSYNCDKSVAALSKTNVSLPN